MLRQFLVGGGVSLVNFTIHALVMTTVVGVARVAGAKKISHPSLFLIVVMIPTVSVLMITHAVEVIVWSFSVLDSRGWTTWRQSHRFCIRQLHDTGLRRRPTDAGLALAWPYNSDERRVAVWVVDRDHF